MYVNSKNNCFQLKKSPQCQSHRPTFKIDQFLLLQREKTNFVSFKELVMNNHMFALFPANVCTVYMTCIPFVYFLPILYWYVL